MGLPPDTPADAAPDAETATATPADEAPEERIFVVSTRPAGARVILDGEKLDGSAPMQISVDPEARHTLRLEMDGYRPLSWSFAVSGLSAAHLETGRLHFPLALIAGNAAPVEEEELTGSVAEWAADVTPSSGEISAVAPATTTTNSESAGAPPPPTSVRRVRAPAQAPAPERIRHVDPELPDDARVAGVVIMEIEVSARGNVVQAKVLRGISPIADQAALAAVVRWKYQPTEVDGVPVRVLMTVTLPIERSHD